MRIRCWGARGSIPVSGPEYNKYGGDTTCFEVRSRNDEIVIIDAGSGIRRLGNALMQEGRHAFTLLFTHSHWDHILGFPFFKPIYHSSTVIDLFGCPFSQGNMHKLLGQAMSPPHFPVPFDQIQARINYHGTCSEAVRFDSLQVSSIPLSHPNQGQGYRMQENGSSAVILTDNELAYVHKGGKTMDDYVEFCKGADLLIHDAEYTDEDYERTVTWGHSRYKDAMELAFRAGVGRFALTHHNQDRSDQGVDELVDRCREIARAKGSDMEIFGLTQESDILL